MVTYWSEFIKKGDPNHLDLPAWPRWCEMDKNILVLNDEIKLKQD